MFSIGFRKIQRMDKVEHGRRLKAAMASRGYGRQVVADAVGVKPRTVTNWTSGSFAPNAADREKLRALLGPYDSEGDAVETAVRLSDLVDWRQDAVLSFYKRNLHEQRAQSAG